MSLRALPLSLVVVLAACTPRATPVAEDLDGSAANAASITQAPDEAPDAAPGAAPDAAPEPTDAEPPAELPSDGGLAALLAGAVDARKLPEIAVDRGRRLDRAMRERLLSGGQGGPDSPGALPAFGASGTVTLGPVVASTAVAQADRVAASLKPRARRCYDQGLQNDPNMQGKLVVMVAVSTSGSVDDATVASSSGLSPEVAECVARAYRTVVFDAPAGGAESTLTVTLTFAPPK